jgi:hypothetical protein
MVLFAIIGTMIVMVIITVVSIFKDGPFDDK